MKFPGAPYGLKMACGENPKRVYGQQGPAPSHAHGQRRRLSRRLHRRQRVPKNRASRRRRRSAGGSGTASGQRRRAGKRDLKLDTLAGVLNGEILRAASTATAPTRWRMMLDLAKEFGFKIAAFHHGVEAYKIADLLGRRRHLRRAVGRLVGLQDGSLRRHPGEHRRWSTAPARLRDRAFRSDEGIQRLNQEAAKVLADARPRRASRSHRSARSAG